MSYELSLTGSAAGLAGPAWLLAAVWWGALGAIVGSFLNVVVYRLPRGLSLVWPGSHCPACQHPIRWYDNIPVLGWVVLGGRCRDCGVRISPRYPIVEGVTSLVFLTVAIMECLSGGGNLPTSATSVAAQAHHSEADIYVFWGITLFHLTLLGTLLPAALIHYDGQRLPWRWASPSLLIGVLASILWPALHPVAAMPHLNGPWTGLLDGMAGLLVGTAAGLLATWRIPTGQRREVVLAAGMVGLYLGWQLGAGAVLAAALAYQICRSMAGAGQARVPFLAWLTALSFGGIIFWRQLAAIWHWTP